jgi:glycerol-3-phosphate dehydrogenase
MSDQIFDVAIVGGGINGCGIARDLSGRGLNVILLEKSDLASGTSSTSTKLIHGGLRYLEHYEFGLVRESLKERERLWKIAPHIIWPLRFILPYQPGLRPKWLIRLGLFVYDHLGGRKLLPATRTVDLRVHPAGETLQSEFRTAFEYSDCWVDDARLVVLNARDAADRGAEIRTQSSVTALARDGDSWRIELEGTDECIRAKAVVNASGPSVLRLLANTQGHARDTNENIRLVRGSHIIVPKLFNTPQAYFFQNGDGRIFFAIPYEEDFTLIGTTDAEHHVGDPIVPSQAEIRYLCDAASEYFLQPVVPGDVIRCFAGVRPLVDDAAGKPENASRGYRFDVGSDTQNRLPMLSIFGGKITTYRHLAEGAVAALKPWFPQISGKGWTADAPLPGGAFPVDGVEPLSVKLACDYPFLSPYSVRRLIRSYGTLAWDWLGEATEPADLGRDFGCGLTRAEVDYLMTREWARTTDDLLWRRSKLGLRLNVDQVAELQTYIASK